MDVKIHNTIELPARDFAFNSLLFKYKLVEVDGKDSYMWICAKDEDNFSINITILHHHDRDRLDTNSAFYKHGCWINRLSIDINQVNVFIQEYNLDDLDDLLRKIESILDGTFQKKLTKTKNEIDTQLEQLKLLEKSKFNEVYRSNLIVKDILE